MLCPSHPPTSWTDRCLAPYKAVGQSSNTSTRTTEKCQKPKTATESQRRCWGKKPTSIHKPYTSSPTCMKKQQIGKTELCSLLILHHHLQYVQQFEKNADAETKWKIDGETYWESDEEREGLCNLCHKASFFNK